MAFLYGFSSRFMLLLRPVLLSSLLTSSALAAPSVSLGATPPSSTLLPTPLGAVKPSPSTVAGSMASLKTQNRVPQKVKSEGTKVNGWIPFRLIVPSIKLDIPILRGSDLKTLASGPGHDLLSAGPGQKGNCVIASHRNIQGAHFWYLTKLSAGSSILVETPREMLRYRVASASVIPETRTDVLDSSIPLNAAPRLTLYTCTLPVSKNRFVVVANLVSRSSAVSTSFNRAAVVPEIVSGPLYLLKDKGLRARAQARLRALKNVRVKPKFSKAVSQSD